MATATTTPAKTHPKREFAMMLTDVAAARIRAVLPPGIDPERFIQTVLGIYNRTPDLQACTTDSIIQSLIKAAEIGLVPNTAHGHAYLVPFNKKQKNGSWVKEAQLVVGYKGYMYMGTKYGIFAAIDSRDVYARDHFEVVFDPEPRMIHRPYLGDDDRGPLTHVYAYGKLKSGAGVVFEVMTRRQIEAVRDSTAKGDKGPSHIWLGNFEEMAKKTVLRRLLKDQPCDDALAKAIGYDAEDETVAATPFEASPKMSRSDALAERLAPRQIEAQGYSDELPFDEPEGVEARPQREMGDEG